MGLDMYAYSVPPEAVIGDFDFLNDEKEEFFYWRKHNALHGYMEDLYKTKGGSEEFNCVPVRLTLEDLYQLKEQVSNKTLKSRQGFFWGTEYEYGDLMKERDLEFLEKAIAITQSGGVVYYNSWW